MTQPFTKSLTKKFNQKYILIVLLILIVLIAPTVYAQTVGRFGTQASEYFGDFLRRNTNENTTKGINLFVLNTTRIFLKNGSNFDAIYGVRGGSSNNTWPNRQDLLNNTLQGKAYLNSSVYPNNIKFGTWNISTQANNLTFNANSSGFIQRSNDSQPYTRSGCFRIHGYSGNLGSTFLPGSIHLGTECQPGWVGAYIDINDVNQNTSNNARLMNFFWNNKGPGNGIGLSMRLDSENAGTVLQDLNYGYTGKGGSSSIINMMRLSVVSFTPNDTIAMGTVRNIEFNTPVATAGMITKFVGLSTLPTTTSNRLRTMVMTEARRNTLTFTGQFVGLGIGNQPRSAAQSATKYNRSYAVISEGSHIQLSAGTHYIYNGPHFLNDNWADATIGNISGLYNYDKDILVTQFAGRLAGNFNVTRMSKREYNLSFAGGVRINDTLSLMGGNITNGFPRIALFDTNKIHLNKTTSINSSVVIGTGTAGFVATSNTLDVSRYINTTKLKTTLPRQILNGTNAPMFWTSLTGGTVNVSNNLITKNSVIFCSQYGSVITLPHAIGGQGTGWVKIDSGALNTNQFRCIIEEAV